MQKLTLKEKAKQLSEELMSDKITKHIKWLRGLTNDIDGKAIPRDTKTVQNSKNTLMQLIVLSKSNYDNKVPVDNELMEISRIFDTKIYSPQNISFLISYISNIPNQNSGGILNEKRLVSFFIFHETLIHINKITETVFYEDINKSQLSVFTIISENNPSLNHLLEVLKKLSEILQILKKIYKEEDIEEQVYILDKGSNTNIGIETGIKTAKSLFDIFKEVWDWLVNRKHYREKLKNATFINNLDALKKLNDLKNEGAITAEDALIYRELIIKRTDELFSLKTVPRELLLESGLTKDEKVVLEYNEIRLLMDGKET